MSKKFIKDEILNTAKRMFNQRGYREVTMREIADALKISVGNLTYHFQRKEDIVEAVIRQTHRYYEPPPTPTSLPELNALFALFQNNVQENAFYFWHQGQLDQLSPSVHKLYRDILASEFDRMEEAFAQLAAVGLMRPEFYPGQYHRLARAVMLVCIYWVPQLRLEDADPAPNDLLDCLWAVLLPMLTEEGREVYEKKVVQVRMVFE